MVKYTYPRLKLQELWVSPVENLAPTVIKLVAGNGGGLGDPKSRDQALVKEDLRNELITPEVARKVYGLKEA